MSEEKFGKVNGGMGKFTCRICGKKFQDLESLQSHLKEKHKTDDWGHAGAANHINRQEVLGLEGKQMNNNYKIIAKAIANGEISKVEFPMENLNTRKLEASEVLDIVKEEFGKVKDLNTMKLPKEKQFIDADLAKEINWADELDLKEFFIK